MNAIERIQEYVTDPEKLGQLKNLPELILGLVVQSGLSEKDFNILRRYDIAYKARGLWRMKAIDYNSTTHRNWAKVEEKFKSNPHFIPFEEMLEDQNVVSMTKREVIDEHPHRLGNLGIEVVGAIPRKKNLVELLVLHNQIRWLPPSSNSGWREEMMELDSENMNIPKQVCKGELKLCNPRRDAVVLAAQLQARRQLKPKVIAQIDQATMEGSTFFFTMPPLDHRSKYYDVIIPT